MKHQRHQDIAVSARPPTASDQHARTEEANEGHNKKKDLGDTADSSA